MFSKLLKPGYEKIARKKSQRKARREDAGGIIVFDKVVITRAKLNSYSLLELKAFCSVFEVSLGHNRPKEEVVEILFSALTELKEAETSVKTRLGVVSGFFD